MALFQKERTCNNHLRMSHVLVHYTVSLLSPSQSVLSLVSTAMAERNYYLDNLKAQQITETIRKEKK